MAAPLMSEVARDYVTDGIPSSGVHEIRKRDLRSWGAWIEQIMSAFLSSGGVIYASKSALDGDLSKPANTMAWVVDGEDSGVYRKVGASGTGSWEKAADLPYSFIVASDAGEGTPDDITATSPLPVSGSALVLLNVFETNTGSPVNVSFNGGTPLTVKSNTGNDIAPGGLQAGMLVMGRVSGSTFRLVTDQVSAAIIAQADAAAQTATEKAAEAIAAAAGVNLPPVAANRILVDNAAGTARESKTFEETLTLLTAVPWLLSPIITYRSFSQVTALSIPAAQKVLKVAGYAAEGDGGAGQWKRVALAPTHGAGLRSMDRYLPNGTTNEANGGWWDLDEAYPNELMFGGVASRNNAQQTAAIQAMLNFAAANSQEALIATGHNVTQTLAVPDHVTVNFAKRGYSGSGAILDKVFNGDLMTLGHASKLKSPGMRGNSDNYTGRGIVISAGADQAIDDPYMTGFQSYCLDFTTGGGGIRFRMNGGLVQSATGHAVRMPATEATTTGFRHFRDVHTGGTDFIDLRNGNYTEIINCVFLGLNYGNTSTGRTIVIGNRIASTLGTLVFGTEHQFSMNTCGTGVTIGSGTTYSKFVGNIIAGGSSVTNSSGNATNQIV